MNKPRSLSYQAFFYEIPLEQEQLDNIPNAPQPSEYKKELLEKLIERTLQLIKDNLSEYDQQLINLIYIQSLTQQDAAKILNTKQYTINKHIHGVSYNKNKSSLLKQIKLICMKDEIIQSILFQLNEVE